MTDDVTHDVLRALRQIMRRIDEHSKYLSREAGLTVPQLLCLKAVGERAPDAELTVAQLAAQVQLSAATTSRIIERLVRGGLVERVRSERDRRRVCLSLSHAGEARFAQLPAPLQERFVARFLALAPREQATILASLSRIATLMDADDFDAAPMLTGEERL